MTNPAVVDFPAQFEEASRQGLGFRNFLPEQVQNQPKGSFPADTRQSGEFVDGFFEQPGCIFR
jgi:hypothetical protein